MSVVMGVGSKILAPYQSVTSLDKLSMPCGLVRHANSLPSVHGKSMRGSATFPQKQSLIFYDLWQAATGPLSG